MHLRQGTLLQNGKYRIERFINSGGFGCTYEAVHLVAKKRIAIKEFFIKDFCNREEDTFRVTVGTNSKKALVEKLKSKFISEANSIWEMHHNGIVRVSDVFEENGTAYYVMDYIEGRSLKEIVEAKCKLSETEALRCIIQVSEALKYVHSKNMLHLDIKPGNIMIDKEDNAILIDFGTSKQYDEVDGENTSTLLGKTPGYAPMEQYKQGGVSKFSPETDIYALGATLYKLVTGITPPEADEIYENGISFPKDMHLSESVKSTITFAMQPKRKDRPQSIEEFLGILDTMTVNKSNSSNSSMKEETYLVEKTFITEDDFETEFNRYFYTSRYEEAFNLCMRYLECHDDKDLIRSKVNLVIPKLKNYIEFPSMQSVSYDWLIDKLILKDYRNLKFSDNLITHRFTTIKISSDGKMTNVTVSNFKNNGQLAACALLLFYLTVGLFVFLFVRLEYLIGSGVLSYVNAICIGIVLGIIGVVVIAKGLRQIVFSYRRKLRDIARIIFDEKCTRYKRL